jgi:proteasome assembly chaperone (PAC2) family protein
VLFVAIAVCIVAVVTGVVVLARAARRVSPRLARLDEVAATGTAVAERARELQARVARIRAETDRLRALTGLGP